MPSLHSSRAKKHSRVSCTHLYNNANPPALVRRERSTLTGPALSDRVAQNTRQLLVNANRVPDVETRQQIMSSRQRNSISKRKTRLSSLHHSRQEDTEFDLPTSKIQSSSRRESLSHMKKKCKRTFSREDDSGAALNRRRTNKTPSSGVLSAHANSISKKEEPSQPCRSPTSPRSEAASILYSLSSLPPLERCSVTGGPKVMNLPLEPPPGHINNHKKTAKAVRWEPRKTQPLKSVTREIRITEAGHIPRSVEWTQEEEDYATALVDYFCAGVLNLPRGTSLDSFLAKRLGCDPARAAHKFSHCFDRALSKVTYKRRREVSTDETSRAIETLRLLEFLFVTSVSNDINTDALEKLGILHTDQDMHLKYRQHVDRKLLAKSKSLISKEFATGFERRGEEGRCEFCQDCLEERWVSELNPAWGPPHQSSAS